MDKASIFVDGKRRRVHRTAQPTGSKKISSQLGSGLSVFLWFYCHRCENGGNRLGCICHLKEEPGREVQKLLWSNNKETIIQEGSEV